MLYYVDIYVCYRSYLCIVDAYTSFFHTNEQNVNKVGATKVDHTITITVCQTYTILLYIET
jgi:hypothetical protein